MPNRRDRRAGREVKQGFVDDDGSFGARSNEAFLRFQEFFRAFKADYPDSMGTVICANTLVTFAVSELIATDFTEDSILSAIRHYMRETKAADAAGQNREIFAMAPTEIVTDDEPQGTTH